MAPADLLHLVDQLEVLLREVALHPPVPGAAGIVGHGLHTAELAGQEPHGLGAVGDDRQALLANQLGQLPLEVRALQQAVLGLHALEARQIELVRHPQGLAEPPGREIRAPHVPDLALAHQVVHGAKRFLDGGVGVHGVGLVEIDEVRIEPPEAGVGRVHDVAPAQTPVVGQVAHRAAALGGQDHLVALARGFEPRTDHLLGAAGPAPLDPGRVVIGRIDEAAARLDEEVQHLRGFLIVGVPPEGGGAKADLRDLQAGGSQLPIFHGDCAPLPFRLKGELLEQRIFFMKY